MVLDRPMVLNVRRVTGIRDAIGQTSIDAVTVYHIKAVVQIDGRIGVRRNEPDMFADGDSLPTASSAITACSSFRAMTRRRIDAGAPTASQ